MRARAAFLAAALAASASAASAELVLEGLRWQVGRVERGRVAFWQDLRVFRDGPPRLGSRLRARVTLKNRGPRAAEGVLLRFSLSARLRPAGGGAEGAWAIPFHVDEKRIPSIGPNRILEVPLGAGAPLDAYLRRLTRSGWRPDRVRLQAMLDPRAGAQSLQTAEDTLEIGG